ncbi:Quinol monooxygenase YgiN [Sulfitobacter brevis]|uniref:Quinol monooxygenase YgiN n=1 Tax=Sulfitobacter brevis TaxID=74348 RepID=A0A1I2GHL6_9RHOB|nr:antibiotic biosynthesis monooxygenase [Sulfitobacter brevis]SFF16539.1 Quinol monooxygenase YgiN [Sulfitobacter brevis]
MIVQTVQFSCAPNQAEKVQLALSDVVNDAREYEPGTEDYRVLRCAQDDKVLFTTIECFSDEAAMALHNTSDAVVRFFDAAGSLLFAPPEVLVSHQVIRM